MNIEYRTRNSEVKRKKDSHKEAQKAQKKQTGSPLDAARGRQDENRINKKQNIWLKAKMIDRKECCNASVGIGHFLNFS